MNLKNRHDGYNVADLFLFLFILSWLCSLYPVAVALFYIWFLQCLYFTKKLGNLLSVSHDKYIQVIEHDTLSIYHRW